MRKTISMQLPDELLEKIKKEADIEYSNISEVIRRILIQYFRDKNETKNT